MNFDKEVIDKMINIFPPILGDDPFGLLMNEDGPLEPIYFDLIQKEICKIDKDAELKFGMSKLVIIAPSLIDVVIKIPFKGFYDAYCDDYDFHNSDIVYFDKDDYEYDFSYFSYARSKKDHSNYCQAEYEIYKKLKERDLDIFVAETQFYTTLSNGMPIYIQERAYSEEDDTSWINKKSSQHSKNLARQLSEDREIAVNQEWIGICIDRYGEKKTEQFLDYCAYKEPMILSDSHTGNIGYREDGSPLIIDYSGFEE